MRLGDSYLEQFISMITFPYPREMTQADIDSVSRKFVDTARLMADSGFSGIELHGAHGYLIGRLIQVLVWVMRFNSQRISQINS